MGNDYFRFKEFTVRQTRAAMKVCTDACVFGAWVAEKVDGSELSILDIGSGTGLLSLMVAGRTKGSVDAVELEEGAFADTHDNFAASPWSARLHAHHTALQNFRPHKKFDLIISNPPFFAHDLRSLNENRNYALHSSELSLRELFRFVDSFLTESGTFALLIAARREKEVEEVAVENHLFATDKVYVHQSFRHSPFRIIYYFRRNRRKEDMIVDKIIIKDADDNYSQRFANLLQPYYLKL